MYLAKKGLEITSKKPRVLQISRKAQVSSHIDVTTSRDIIGLLCQHKVTKNEQNLQQTGNYRSDLNVQYTNLLASVTFFCLFCFNLGDWPN